MDIKRKIKLLFALLALSSAAYAQGRTPDFAFELGKIDKAKADLK